MYKPMASVHDRFPGLQGVMLENKIFAVYQVGPERSIPFFDPKNRTESFVDHPLNRNQKQSVFSYAESCEMYGNCGECRGSPWAQLSDGDVGPYKMLTYRQVTKGVYLAFSRSPLNPLVKYSIDQGLHRVRSLRAKTPNDVIEWLIRHHNSFHKGSGNSLVDIIPEVKRMEADWLAEANIKGLQARTCGSGEDNFYSRRWSWLKDKRGEHYMVVKDGIIKSQNVFDSVCTFMRNMEYKNTEWIDDFKKAMNAITDYRNPLLKLDTMALNVHSLTSLLRANFLKTIASDDLKVIAFETFPFFVTLGRLPGVASPTASNRKVPFIGETHKHALLKSVLTLSMNGSVVLKQPTEAPAGGGGPTSAAPPGKRRRRATWQLVCLVPPDFGPAHNSNGFGMTTLKGLSCQCVWGCESRKTTRSPAGTGVSCHVGLMPTGRLPRPALAVPSRLSFARTFVRLWSTSTRVVRKSNGIRRGSRTSSFPSTMHSSS